MSRGGKREGAGRKKGALTVRTQKIAEQAAKEGKTPLEVMLDNMRHFQQVALSAEAVIESLSAEQVELGDASPEAQFKKLLAEVKKAAGFRQMAHECARDAAGYLHPKLQSIAHTGDDGGPLQIIVRRYADD
jgi:hypothetical protein